MVRKAIRALIVGLFTVVVLGYGAIAAETPFGVWTTDELKAQLDNSDIVIVDVRTGSDWSNSDQKIKSAIRVEQNEAGTLVDKYPKDQILVFYCA